MNDLIRSIENEFNRLNAETTLTENQFFVILSGRDIKHHEEDVGLVPDTSANLDTRDGACHHNDGHIHFYCETCHQSFCLDDIHVPQFSLPSGFVARSMSFVIKGQCEKCSKKRNG